MANNFYQNNPNGQTSVGPNSSDLYGSNDNGGNNGAQAVVGSGNIVQGKGLFGLTPYQTDVGAFGQIGNSAADMYGAQNLSNNPFQANLASSNQSRDQQNALIQMLMAQAQGRGPSVAQAQLRQASDQNVQQTMAMMAAQRGAGANASAYQAANAGGQAGQQLAANSATLRLQEQQGAQSALMNTLNGQRSQDLNGAQMGLQAQQLTNQMVQFYLSQGNSIDQANRQAQIDLQKLNEQSYYGNSPPDSSVGGAASSVTSGVGGIIAAAA